MIAKITLIVPMSEYKSAFDYIPTWEEVEDTFRDRLSPTITIISALIKLKWFLPQTKM